MKVTDYAPRAAPFDSHVMKLGLDLVGVEIGVDVGAHAQAMLEYCDIAHLHLVDPWPNPYCRGYCDGRLAALGLRSRISMMQCPSVDAAGSFGDGKLDFAYIDQEHDSHSVTRDLTLWWPKVRIGGLLGYRNYVTKKTPLVLAVDEFIASIGQQVKATVETGEIVLLKL
jgi:methyltransferase family protein